MTPRFVLGLDLGQSSDWTALIGLACHEDPGGTHYSCLLIERWRGRSYMVIPGLITRAEAALQRLATDADITLVVDGTGVGAGVIDLLEASGLRPMRISITGGTSVNRLARGGFSVPKADLVAVVQVLLEARRLQIAEDLPHAETLARELQNFRYDYSPSGHMRFGAGGDELIWRGEGAHDDLVLALAVAAWQAERAVAPLIVAPGGVEGGSVFRLESGWWGPDLSSISVAGRDPWA